MAPEGYVVNWTAVVLAFAVGVVAMGLMLAASTLLSPRRPSKTKGIAYESGILPTPLNWTQFNVRYYIFAILFLIFDVEAVFLFSPWALVFADEGIPGYVVLRDDALHRRAAAGRRLRLAEGGAAMEVERGQTLPVFRPSSWERPLGRALFDSPEGGAVSTDKGNSPAPT